MIFHVYGYTWNIINDYVLLNDRSGILGTLPDCSTQRLVPRSQSYHHARWCLWERFHILRTRAQPSDMVRSCCCCPQAQQWPGKSLYPGSISKFPYIFDVPLHQIDTMYRHQCEILVHTADNDPLIAHANDIEDNDSKSVAEWIDWTPDYYWEQWGCEDNTETHFWDEALPCTI